jgi:hypothetical protein
MTRTLALALALACSPSDHYLDVDTATNSIEGADLLWAANAPAVYAINGTEVSAPFRDPQPCDVTPTPYPDLDADLFGAWYCVHTDIGDRRPVYIAGLGDAGDIEVVIPQETP